MKPITRGLGWQSSSRLQLSTIKVKKALFCVLAEAQRVGCQAQPKRTVSLVIKGSHARDNTAARVGRAGLPLVTGRLSEQAKKHSSKARKDFNVISRHLSLGCLEFGIQTKPMESGDEWSHCFGELCMSLKGFLASFQGRMVPKTSLTLKIKIAVTTWAIRDTYACWDQSLGYRLN